MSRSAEGVQVTTGRTTHVVSWPTAPRPGASLSNQPSSCRWLAESRAATAPSAREPSTLPVTRLSSPVSTRSAASAEVSPPGRRERRSTAPPRDVATEQEPLRTPQHLDGLKIQHVHDDAVVHAQVHAVDEDADGRIDGRNGTGHPQAANGEVGDALAGANSVQGNIGQGVAEILVSVT